VWESVEGTSLADGFSAVYKPTFVCFLLSAFTSLELPPCVFLHNFSSSRKLLKSEREELPIK
jgi:hypothetical protein